MRKKIETKIELLQFITSMQMVFGYSELLQSIRNDTTDIQRHWYGCCYFLSWFGTKYVVWYKLTSRLISLISSSKCANLTSLYGRFYVVFLYTWQICSSTATSGSLRRRVSTKWPLHWMILSGSSSPLNYRSISLLWHWICSDHFNIMDLQLLIWICTHSSP